MITYTYDNAGRRNSMDLSNDTTSFVQANYTYDTRGRIAAVGNSTDTLTYTYIPGTNMVGSSAWQNASINTVNTYDQYKRLTNIAVNGSNVYGYTLNDKNQRTSATLPDDNKWNYTYDVMGQLTGAVKQDTANNPLANMNYFYDLIGNRTSATENSATTTYASNLVNQYTAVNTVVPVYDLDGNMTSYNGWSYTYNGENRLIVAENAAAGVRIEADYDYMGRRLFKKVYNNNTLTKHAVFVYDGFKQIAEFDVLNNNSLKASYLWQPVGLDVVLLRNDEYFIADGNKNIIQVRNATGSVTDSYVYDPFGKVAHNGSSENTFQFSSEIFDNETGLVYYNYRYYSPELGRWTKRDPLEEDGGMNLYCICCNNNIISYDENGLFLLTPIIDQRGIILAGMKKFWFKDDEGYQIFARWVMGTGDWIDAPFGNYLMKSNDLKVSIQDEVNKILKTCTNKINTVNHEFHAELSDNGYKTGYELLHGTNKKVGDFRITGKIIKKSNQCFWGSLKYQWNDIIDSNPQYFKDRIYDIIGRAAFAFSPRDYTIRISFYSEFNARKYYSTYIYDDYPGVKR